MQTTVARNLLVLLTAVVMSGCYSNGRWSAPNLAFWKSSPFQSAPVATPGTVGSPVRPSGIAASNTTAPPANYASTGVTTPPVTSQGTVMGYTAPGTAYPAAQSPYGSTSSGVAQTTTPANYAPTYMASTAGVPGASAYGTASAPTSSTSGQYGSTGAATSPYGSANAYPSTPTSPYSTTPTVPSYVATNPATAPSGGYASSGASFDANNPVRSASPYPTTEPVRSNAIADGSAGSYGNQATSSTTTPATPGYGTTGGSGYPSDYTPRYGQTASTATGPSGTDTTASSGNGYATPQNSSAPSEGNRYSWSSTTPPTANTTPSATSGSGYPTPTGSDSTNTGANPYAPPGGYPAPPTDAAGEQTEYRPGSTSDYVPRNSATTSGSLSSSPTVLPAVSPVGYTTPAYGTGM